jgi:hypothetical protein
MNFISGTWTGTISGTNVGSFILELEEKDGQLSGNIRLTDFNLGLSIFDCAGVIRDNNINLDITPRSFPEGSRIAPGKVVGAIQPDGSLTGHWSTELGTAGTFIAFKREIPSGQPIGVNTSASPAMAVSFEKQTRLKSCVIDIDILRRIYRELSTGSDEAARLEIAKQTQLSTAPAAANVPPQQLDFAKTRSLYNVTILAKGLNGEQIMSLDPAILDESHLPKPLVSIQFDIGNFYQYMRNMLAPNRATIRLDFTKPPLFDLSNPSLAPTPNDSIIMVAGNDSMWVSGVYEKMVTTLRHGRVRSAWLHSRYTYDALLLILGLPAALAAGSLIGNLVTGNTLKQFATFLFALFLSLSVFRIAFSAIRWLLPMVEFSGLPQPLHRQVRWVISTVILGAIGSLAAALVWFAITKTS